MTTEQFLKYADWQDRAQRHTQSVYRFTASFREQRARRRPHPVYDFLFTYYQFSSRKLEQWHPGFAVTLEFPPPLHSALSGCGEAVRTCGQFDSDGHYERTAAGISLSRAAIGPQEIQRLKQVQAICSAVANRSPRFTCFGLHEWAMVYQSDQVRHDRPLRLPADQIKAVVDQGTVCCSHFDAFRFFTPASRCLNVLQPTADGRLLNEQGGCIHANMDLYKWAFKLFPLISSDLLRECFMLAVSAREIDMRASPYELRDLGFEPITIETAAGREQYVAEQRAIAGRAAGLRQELLADAGRILSAFPGSAAAAA